MAGHGSREAICLGREWHMVSILDSLLSVTALDAE